MDPRAAPPTVEDAQAALLRDGALQFNLPTAAPPPPPGHPWRFPNVGFGDAGAVWILLGLGAALAVGLTVAVLRGRAAPPERARSAAAPAAVAPAAARLALGDADRLAAEGRHLDAARALLLCGLDALAERHPGLLGPTTTSRDIAGDASLPAPMRQGFGRIARAVEIGLFGGRPVGPDDYAACRRAFLLAAFAGEDAAFAGEDAAFAGGGSA